MDANSLHSAYQSAAKRLLLLDYDGTLADFAPTPPEAKPSARLLTLLEKLTADPKNTIVVVSGRDHETLDAWMGDLPVAFAAEHGLLLKEPGKTWRIVLPVNDAWKPSVREIMEAYANQLPGALVEEKQTALSWHTRAAADADRAEGLQAELVAKLQPLAASLQLRIISGSRVVEVQPAGADKGVAAHHWLNKDTWGFVLAAGDDTTDEDLFKAMPEHAVTVKVRPGLTAAKHHVDTPAEMLTLLENLAN